MSASSLLHASQPQSPKSPKNKPKLKPQKPLAPLLQPPDPYLNCHQCPVQAQCKRVAQGPSSFPKVCFSIGIPHQWQLSFRGSFSLSCCGMLYSLPFPLSLCLPSSPAPQYSYYDARPWLYPQLLLTRQHDFPLKPAPMSAHATT